MPATQNVNSSSPAGSGGYLALIESEIPIKYTESFVFLRPNTTVLVFHAPGELLPNMVIIIPAADGPHATINSTSSRTFNLKYNQENAESTNFADTLALVDPRFDVTNTYPMDNHFIAVFAPADHDPMILKLHSPQNTVKPPSVPPLEPSSSSKLVSTILRTVIISHEPGSSFVSLRAPSMVTASASGYNLKPSFGTFTDITPTITASPGISEPLNDTSAALIASLAVASAPLPTNTTLVLTDYTTSTSSMKPSSGDGLSIVPIDPASLSTTPVAASQSISTLSPNAPFSSAFNVHLGIHTEPKTPNLTGPTQRSTASSSYIFSSTADIHIKPRQNNQGSLDGFAEGSLLPTALTDGVSEAGISTITITQIIGTTTVPFGYMITSTGGGLTSSTASASSNTTISSVYPTHASGASLAVIFSALLAVLLGIFLLWITFQMVFKGLTVAHIIKKTASSFSSIFSRATYDGSMEKKQLENEDLPTTQFFQRESQITRFEVLQADFTQGWRSGFGYLNKTGPSPKPKRPPRPSISLPVPVRVERDMFQHPERSF